jgi:hypothetical protein
MLVKRDFEVPELQVDMEARGRGTGVQWISPARVRCTQISEAARISEDHLSSPPKARSEHVRIGFQPAPSETRRPNSSPSIRDLDVIHPVSSPGSALPPETELEDLSVAATPSTSGHGQLTRPTPTETIYKRAGKSILKFLLSLVSSPTIACLLSLTIALVPQLKALFVAVPGVNMPDAPDGEAPLAWILDITTFGG